MIKEALDEYARSMVREFGDRTKTVGSSEVGLCIRRVWYAKHGRGGPGVVGAWGAWVRGTVMEDCFWYPALKAKYGAKLKYAGPDQKTLRRGQLSATPDGILTGVSRDCLAHLGVPNVGSSCILVECKSVDPRVDVRVAREENVFQVQVQMGLVRDCTRYQPNYALISYTDASFWDEVDEFAIRFDPKVYEAAKVRAARIFGATELSEVKPEGWISGGRECEYCPFLEPCGGARHDVPARRIAPLDDQFIAEVEDLCREANKVRKRGDSAYEEFRDYQEQIKQRLRDKGVNRIPGVVSWSTVKGRRTYDMEKLRADLLRVGIDLAPYESFSDPSDRLNIS